MNRLPERLNLDHLKKQAKDLIRRYRSRDGEAIARFRHALPAAANRSDDEIASLKLRLHDAQSCVARDYGFASWTDLRSYVAAQSAARDDHAARVLRWLALVYSAEIGGTVDRANPRVAVRMLAESPDLVADSPYLACAIGDEDALRQATQADPAWVDRAGGPLKLPPLTAITHSSLLQVPELRERLHRCARFLLTAGANPNQRIGNRWPPASLSKPDDDHPLSALYGAAGKNHDPGLTKLLLDAGADPNDGESLYHSLENPACTRLLLEHGARIEGSNALYRALDFDNVGPLALLLEHGADPNEPARNAPLTDWGTPLLWAIRRRRSPRHIAALLTAGADPSAMTPSGISAYRLALQFGLEEVAGLLRGTSGMEPISDEDMFVAACARGDEAEARRIRSARPDLPATLLQPQLRLLPDMTGLERVRAQSRGLSRQCRVDAVSAGARRELDRDARPRRQCLRHAVVGVMQRAGRGRRLGRLRAGAARAWHAIGKARWRRPGMGPDRRAQKALLRRGQRGSRGRSPGCTRPAVRERQLGRRALDTTRPPRQRGPLARSNT
jgi:hypothetical protein